MLLIVIYIINSNKNYINFQFIYYTNKKLYKFIINYFLKIESNWLKTKKINSMIDDYWI